MLLTTELEAFVQRNPQLPTPSQQATNIIRFIGESVSATGEPIELLAPRFHAKVGSPSRAFAISLLFELARRGLTDALQPPDVNGPLWAQDVTLTLAGWELYEDERKGTVAGNYGFLALKFGDPILDPLVRDHVKPAIAALGFGLVDMRDVARAGVIDNLMRVQIRDSAFVVVDLTHENAGAYWEAGYAEGLGKPVLYICEQGKFDEKKTHFDTNHCTTVLWNVDAIPHFVDELIATLRRSLNI